MQILLQEFRGVRANEDKEMIKEVEALGKMADQLRKSGLTSFSPVEDIEEVCKIRSKCIVNGST